MRSLVGPLVWTVAYAAAGVAFLALVLLTIRFWVPYGPLNPEQVRRWRICRRLLHGAAALAAACMLWCMIPPSPVGAGLWYGLTVGAIWHAEHAERTHRDGWTSRLGRTSDT